MADPPSDYELLERWRAGDDASGNALAERHVASLYRFFHNKAGDALEDLAQKTLLACVEAKARIDPARSFRAYLLGIARHQLFRHYRELRRDNKGEQLAQLSVTEIIGSPSGEVAAEQERQLLLAALRRLPLDAQIVFELYYWEGMTIAEIGSTLDEADGTIKSRLSRGKTALREIIASFDADPQRRDSTLTRLEDWALGLRNLADRRS